MSSFLKNLLRSFINESALFITIKTQVKSKHSDDIVMILPMMRLAALLALALVSPVAGQHDETDASFFLENFRYLDETLFLFQQLV